MMGWGSRVFLLLLVAVGLAAFPSIARADAAPDVTVTTPMPQSQHPADTELGIAGNATDDGSVGRVQVAIKNTETGQWYRGEGWGAFKYHDATLDAPGAPSTAWSFAWTPPVPAKYALLAKVTDTSGIAGASKPWVPFFAVDPAVGADETPPTAVVESPVRFANYGLGEPLELSGTASDDVAVARVQVAIKDLDQGLWYRTDGWGSFQYHDTDLDNGNWTLAWVPENLGKHAVLVKATDTAGNAAQDKPWVPFQVVPPEALDDTEIPDVTIASPERNATYTVNEAIAASGIASDDVGVARVEIRRRFGDWTDATLEMPGATSSPWLATFVPTTAGSQTWQVRVTDLALKRRIRPVNFTVVEPVEDDDVAPVSGVHGKTNGTLIVEPNTVTTLSGGVTDNVSIEGVQVGILDPDTGEWYGPGGWGAFQLHDAELLREPGATQTWWHFDWPVPSTFDSSYELHVRATDTAGNVQDTDTTAPITTAPVGAHTPVAVDDTAQTAVNEIVRINFLDNDSDADDDITDDKMVVSGGKNGVARKQFWVAPGTVDFEPNYGFVGTGGFGYRVCDTSGLCDFGIVRVTVG